MNEITKTIRMSMIEEDIQDSLFFESGYKEIKVRYQTATTDEEWEKAVDDHEVLSDKEVDFLRQWASSIKKVKFKGELN
jgi:nicotinamide mononucleotide adenylyltransferase